MWHWLVLKDQEILGYVNYWNQLQAFTLGLCIMIQWIIIHRPSVNDPAYVKVGMIGENINTKNVLVVKVHGSPSKVKRVTHIDKAIYIIRNPFGVILAEHNRNTAKISKMLDKNYTGNTHLLEVDFNYGMCVCMLHAHALYSYSIAS